MTDEEAREVLKQIRKKKCVSECDYNCKLYESETFCLEEKALDMAIKVLEQQPSEDCISRDEAINVVKKWFDKIKLNGDICLDGIVSLPSVTPKTRWIPVSERLPEEAYGCIVTVMDTNPMTLEEFEHIYPDFVGWDGENWNDSDGDSIPFEVMAWMPLPDAYREADKEVKK